jgi:hypothetical protein
MSRRYLSMIELRQGRRRTKFITILNTLTLFMTQIQGMERVKRRRSCLSITTSLKLSETSLERRSSPELKGASLT